MFANDIWNYYLEYEKDIVYKYMYTNYKILKNVSL